MKKVKGILLRASYRVSDGVLVDHKDLISFIYNALNKDTLTTFLHGTYQLPPFRLKYVQRRSNELSLFIAFLDDQSAHAFVQQIAEWGCLKLGNISCALKGCEEIDNVLLPIDWNSELPSRFLALEFFTPTFFQSDSTHLPLPVPILLWGNLVKLFVTYTHAKLPESIKDDIERYVTIRTMQLKSETAKFSNLFKTPGFVGRVEFQVEPEAPIHLAKVLTLLSKWAEFAGVGMKTAYGMGSVGIVNDLRMVQALR